MDKNNRLIILGGNPETAYLIKFLETINVHTICLDPDKNSLAKKYSSESYDIDCLDYESLLKLTKRIKFDGILVGVADILVPNYYKLCTHYSLPTYSNKKTLEYFSTKKKFIEICEKFLIGVTPYFKSDDVFDKTHLPVLVKPVDSGGGIGMRVVNNINQLNDAINFAKDNSKKGSYLIEKLMNCDDMAAHYSFIDGEVILTATNDRYTSKKTSEGSPVCIGAAYPSRHTDQFIDEVHPKLLEMFKFLNIKNGVLNIQFFRDEDGIYAYDPGFRLQGEGVHIHLKHYLDIDHREFLALFALNQQTKNFFDPLKNNIIGHLGRCVTVWVLLGAGKIFEVNGLKSIMNLKSYKDALIRFNRDDVVTEDMLGTEKQVFARFYLQNQEINELKKDIDTLNKILEVKSRDGNMILDSFSSSLL